MTEDRYSGFSLALLRSYSTVLHGPANANIVEIARIRGLRAAGVKPNQAPSGVQRLLDHQEQGGPNGVRAQDNGCSGIRTSWRRPKAGISGR